MIKFCISFQSSVKPEDCTTVFLRELFRKLNSLTGNFGRRQQIVIFSDTNVSHFRSLGALPQGKGDRMDDSSECKRSFGGEQFALTNHSLDVMIKFARALSPT